MVVVIFDYKSYCIKTIRRYTRKNNVYKVYLFLLNNLEFVHNSTEKFRNTSISKAYDLIEECDYKINETDSEIFRIKCVNIRNILTQYLEQVF